MTWFGDLISAITGVFTSLGTGILNFLKTGFTTLMLETTTTTGGATEITGVSVLGYFTFGLIGIALVIGLTRWITSLVRAKI